MGSGSAAASAALTTYQDAKVQIATIGAAVNQCSPNPPQVLSASETNVLNPLIGGAHAFEHTVNLLSLDDGKFVLQRLGACPARMPKPWRRERPARVSRERI
ncbi:hypothetical protein [Bradyrhizobium prioriisuperbiae]|uniref:hypothetical protein n=1 Tax=Bradyrhizobium prioriisuperbiae TaxID=2854389 RepID=UPI0028E78A63|nr:hypothetical protein [Bradyrhizobium prioritasuperba]